MDGERGQERRIHLLGAYELIHKHLSAEVCEEVFAEIRDAERRRKWTLQALLYFWMAVIMDPPKALQHALTRVTGQSNTETEASQTLPKVDAHPGSFFERCQQMKPGFFEVLFGRFGRAIRPEAPRTYGSTTPVGSLRERFRGGIVIFDGSRLDAIAHRLKIMWRDRSVILPGCVLGVYDLFRGMLCGLQFEADAARSEFQRALEGLQIGLPGWSLEPDTLVMGDRLYCSPQIFEILGRNKAWGLFRRNRTLKFKKIKRLKSYRHDGGRVQEWLVEAGCGATAPIQRLRYIRYQRKKRVVWELFTNVLDAKHLSGPEALALYRQRWTIERMFYDLKVVLNLKRFYAANPNAVAMQVYASGIVYNALRIVQARAARQARVVPEELSPAKLFPLMLAAVVNWMAQEAYFIAIQEANPNSRLRKPDWKHDPKTCVPLSAVRVHKRSAHRRKRRFCGSRRRWKSLAHLPGGARLT
jgi:hypothetical protein